MIPVPKSWRESWLMTVSVSTSRTPAVTASQLMPRNRKSRIPAIHVSVLAAFLDTGSANAWTPLAMASTPVIAAQPEANARSSKKRVNV